MVLCYCRYLSCKIDFYVVMYTSYENKLDFKGKYVKFCLARNYHLSGH